MQFQEKKYQNLQFKYLRLLNNKKNDIFTLNENFSTVILMKNRKRVNKSNNNINNLIFSSPNKLNDDINRIQTIMDNIDINNINNNININVNNNNEFNTIQNNQRFFSPKLNINDKNESRESNNLLPILKNERNLSISKEPKLKLKLVDNIKNKNCLIKNDINKQKKKELNNIIFTEANKLK